MFISAIYGTFFQKFFEQDLWHCVFTQIFSIAKNLCEFGWAQIPLPPPWIWTVNRSILCGQRKRATGRKYSYHSWKTVQRASSLGGLQHMPSFFLDRSFGNFYADLSFPNSPFLSAAFPTFVSSIWKPWRLDGSSPSYVLPVGILLCVPYIFLNSSCSFSTRYSAFF